MKRKWLPLLLILVLLLSATALFACIEHKEQEEPAAPASTEEKQVSVLFLGDSIGEALAGPSPLTERENYGYYGIIGNINGFSYYNRAVTAYTTKDLMNFVSREDDGVNMVRSLIQNADVIHISNFGNDFLNTSHNQLMVDLANDVYTRINPISTEAKANFKQTITTIKQLNPNALILVQTLYNPAGEDSPLVPTYARNYLASKGIGPDKYHEIMDKLIFEINKSLREVQEENTVTDENGNEIAPYEIIDVYSALEKVYREDNARWQRLICEDGVHPTAEAHALIAEKIQNSLAAHGLTAQNALHNYKRDKVRQLNRLYANIENKEQVRQTIMRAATFGEVTKAYFDGTQNKIPHGDPGKREGKTFSITKTFDVTMLSVFGDSYTGFVDRKKAKIEFNKNGEYTLYIPLLEVVTGLAKYYIESEGPINANSKFSFGLATDYFSDIAPGVDKSDLEGILKEIERLYGISVIGIDFENPAVQQMLENYRQTGQLIISTPDVLDDVIGIVCRGTYSVETMTVGDKTLTAIYVNNAVGKGESYIRYTYYVNEEDEECVRMTIDVLKIELEGVIYEDDEE